MVTLMRPTTGGERTHTGAPVSFGPPSPWPPLARQEQDGQGSQGEIRDLFRGNALRAWELDGEDQSDNAEIDLTQSVDELETALSMVNIL